MILLIGGSGYVGRAFRSFFLSHNIKHRTISRSENNYYDAGVLTRLIKETGATFLINAAGFTGNPNVDACELQKSDCLMGNVVLPSVIMDVCKKAGLPWGHVSSGCIYSGRRKDGAGFNEGDTPNFSFRSGECSFYSGTKALSEELLGEAPQCYIWRLRIPFDNRDCPRNYLSKMMSYDVLLDVENSISHLPDFVKACWQGWQKRVPFGTYNLTNAGAVTTREVVNLIKHYRPRSSNRPFKFFKNTAEFMRSAAKTPRSSCVLDTTKAEKVGIAMRPAREAIIDSLSNWTRAGQGD